MWSKCAIFKNFCKKIIYFSQNELKILLSDSEFTELTSLVQIKHSKKVIINNFKNPKYKKGDSNCLGIKGSSANTSASFFDASLPGTMPTLNEASVKSGLVSALALKCKINTVSYFERKHYFYADLPAGYQITQQKRPIAFDGNFVYPVVNPQTHTVAYKTAKIRRIQLEHDSARTLQSGNLSFELNKNIKIGQNAMLIDLNRAGIGLMEIVTEPVFEEAFDVYSFVRELSSVLRAIETCETIMDDGGFRVDVNVSVHKLRRSNDPKVF